MLLSKVGTSNALDCTACGQLILKQAWAFATQRNHRPANMVATCNVCVSNRSEIVDPESARNLTASGIKLSAGAVRPGDSRTAKLRSAVSEFTITKCSKFTNVSHESLQAGPAQHAQAWALAVQIVDAESSDDSTAMQRS